MKKRLLLISAVLSFSLAAQVPGTITASGGTIASSPDTLTNHTISFGGTSTGITTGTLLMSSGGTTATWRALDGQGNWRDRPMETRKATGPGVTLKQVKLSAALLDKKQLASSSYLTTAARIGLKSAATDEARVLQAIEQLCLPVYDFDKVDNYLYRAALKQGTNVRWVWKPMRDLDLEASKNGGLSWESRMGFLYPKVYGQRTPEEILETAGAILEVLPDAVLLVSDYEVIKPDPFLAISTKRLLQENKLWIVAQWDEPGFGAAPVRAVPVNQTVAASSLTIRGSSTNPGSLSAESGDLKISTLPDGTLSIDAH